MAIEEELWRILLLVSLFTLKNVKSLSLNNFLMTGPKAYLVFAESVAAGAQTGVEECQHQFKWDRWNCPHSSFPVFTHNKHAYANRETAFVQAISSAGVMYTLTRNCSMGDFEKCTCDDSRKGQTGGPNWKWGGCSDNVRFGERISRLFVDALETGKDARATVNLHNNEAGRRGVRKTLKLTCKCHGVSGSCTTKTCWHQLAEFRVVGAYLKRKYVKACKVDFNNGVLQKGNAATTQNLSPKFSPLSKNALAFLDHSPDYCFANSTYGTRGTLSRECVRPAKRGKGNRWERKSCKRLCISCGLKVTKSTVQVQSTCNCKFHWCCQVKCQKCKEMKVVFKCAR